VCAETRPAFIAGEATRQYSLHEWLLDDFTDTEDDRSVHKLKLVSLKGSLTAAGCTIIGVNAAGAAVVRTPNI